MCLPLQPHHPPTREHSCEYIHTHHFFLQAAAINILKYFPFEFLIFKFGLEGPKLILCGNKFKLELSDNRKI